MSSRNDTTRKLLQRSKFGRLLSWISSIYESDIVILCNAISTVTRSFRMFIYFTNDRHSGCVYIYHEIIVRPISRFTFSVSRALFSLSFISSNPYTSPLTYFLGFNDMMRSIVSCTAAPCTCSSFSLCCTAANYPCNLLQIL